MILARHQDSRRGLEGQVFLSEPEGASLVQPEGALASAARQQTPPVK